MPLFNFNLDKASPLPLYYQLKMIIKKEIEEKRWLPNEMIPTEMEIMEHYSLSRTTIRQALNDLVKDNVLYRKKGVGTFVAVPKIDLQYLENSLDFNYQILRMGLVPSTKVLKPAVIKADEKLAQEMEIASGTEAILLKRLRFAEQEPVALVTSYLPYSQCSFIMDVDLEKESLYQTLALNESTRVVKVKRFVEAQTANSGDCKGIVN